MGKDEKIEELESLLRENYDALNEEDLEMLFDLVCEITAELSETEFPFDEGVVLSTRNPTLAQMMMSEVGRA